MPKDGIYNPVKAQSEMVVVCGKCSCSWLELILVSQFSKFNTVILGQRPMAKDDLSFYLYKCPRCGHFEVPEVFLGARDTARLTYDQFCRDLEETQAEKK